MQDRVSLYPGRVKLAPVAGQENTYDMVRADSPTQDGTPLNKDSLLKDTTSALFGLGADAVPDDAFQKIKTLINNVQSSADSKARIQIGSYVGTGTYGANNPCSLTFNFEPNIVAIFAKHSEYGYGDALSLEDNFSATFIKDVTCSTMEWWSNSKVYYHVVSWANNKLSWYSLAKDQYGQTSAGNSEAQLNKETVIYYYYAIGSNN